MLRAVFSLPVQRTVSFESAAFAFCLRATDESQQRFNATKEQQKRGQQKPNNNLDQIIACSTRNSYKMGPNNNHTANTYVCATRTCVHVSVYVCVCVCARALCVCRVHAFVYVCARVCQCFCPCVHVCMFCLLELLQCHYSMSAGINIAS